MKTKPGKRGADGKLKNGVFKEHFKDGSLACAGQYLDGEKAGVWKYYLRNGQLRAVGKFADGKMTGEWKWYRENGKLMQTGSFVEERKSGVWKRYHPNGALHDEGGFADNRKVGEWRVYDTGGNLVKTINHKTNTVNTARIPAGKGGEGCGNGRRKVMSHPCQQTMKSSLQEFYTDTFIQVAPDCAATAGLVPPSRGGAKTVPLIEHELLSASPYKFTQHELIFETHVRRQGISPAEAGRRRAAIWEELFRKPHPCLRASMLPKKYGWGVHYDDQGRIAIFAVNSPEYARFTQAKSGGPKLLFAMRSKRA
jgi:hypothetical protein